MSDTKLNAPNRSINEVKASGDNLNWIENNKPLVVGLIVLILAIVGGVGGYKVYSENKMVTSTKAIYDFEEGALKMLAENKLSADDAMKSFKDLKSNVGRFEGLAIVGLKLADQLMIQNKKVEALETLNLIKNDSKDVSEVMVFTRLAVLNEDLGKNQEAIAILQDLNSKKFKGFEGKNYLDLGRLYLKTGDKEKAKSSFQFVVDKAKDEIEFVRIAKLYLSEM